MVESCISVRIGGAVQGVGFRPFVFRLASELGLRGWVENGTGGVAIEVEGADPAIASFVNRLRTEAPPRAIIHEFSVSPCDCAGYPDFRIRESDSSGEKTALVLPDIATCAECLVEVLDRSNRRTGYPLTNCTLCGPRYSIIRALPYDRPNTTMAGFPLCAACLREYHDPSDRRFHAQPTACASCGPQLAFRPAQDGAKPEESADEPLMAAARLLRSGRILALKGLGGYQLIVDARDPASIERLRVRKNRRDKPFAVMMPDLASARRFCVIPEEAASALESAEAPIVLLRRRPAADPRGDGPGSPDEIAPEVAPGIPDLGVMLPYTPLHHMLMREIGFPVVATSGNLTDEPICIEDADASERLGAIADGFLVHNRPIERHVDDSVGWVINGAFRLLRRARGYAPLPVMLAKAGPEVLAVGAHLKNTVAITLGRRAFISQHIGDLETPEALEAFERVISDLLQLYEVTPVAIAHDLHPGYASTAYAMAFAKARLGARLVGVQHHHAHLAACLADNGHTGAALGVVWDGTGYGPDGAVWGGEFLLGDARAYRRLGHLRPFRLPGGDAAVQEPRRVALALLWELYGEAALEMTELSPMRSFRAEERRVLGQMLAQGVRSPVTTSMGRLFDGVAALCGLEQRVTYEGQAAISLEHAASDSDRDAYALPWLVTPGAPWILDWGPMLEAIVRDVRSGRSAGEVSASMHAALVQAAVEAAARCGEATVALSGGCFQNRLLTERLAPALERSGHRVLLHCQVPPNDGGISLGQAAVAAATL